MITRPLCILALSLPAAITLQARPVDDFRAEAQKFSQSLRRANETLRCIHDKASADAASDVIADMLEARDSMAGFCQNLQKQGWSAERLYAEAGLKNILRNMPSGIYNQLAKQELDAGCHGSARLYVALTGTSEEFTQEQIDAPLDEQDKATLAAIGRTLKAICLLMGRNPGISMSQAEPMIKEDLALAREGEARLKRSPAAMAELHRMAAAAQQPLADFFNHFLANSGEWQDILFFKAQDNFLTRLYSPDAGNILKSRLSCLRPDQHFVKVDALYRKSWQEIAPAIEEYRKTHDLGDGDGRSPETSFALPEGMKLEDSRQFLYDFAYHAAGDRAIPSPSRCYPEVSRNGRRYTYASIFAGRPGDINFQGDSNLVLPIYFYERNKP